MGAGGRYIFHDERTFEDKESLSIRPTSHGIKIVLSSTHDGYQKSDPCRHAARWPSYYARRDDGGVQRKKKKTKKRAAVKRSPG